MRRQSPAQSPSNLPGCRTAFVVWSPALIPIVREFFTADYDLQGWGDALMLSTDLLGWFTATAFTRSLAATWWRRCASCSSAPPTRPARLPRCQHRLSGLGDAGPGRRSARSRTGARCAVWVWTSLIFGVLTLGPLLQINGRYRFDLDGLETTVPLPFALLHYIPVIKANRAPNRNSVLLMLGLAVLAGYGVYWLLGLAAPAHPLTRSPGWLTPGHPWRRPPDGG
jgi:hypothetical protein